ncbi:MAG TPA: hypothetical protein VNT26_04965 [Candidatus Sulfotelmatobacter sp.]|nr:hypothetical protein [Candidatus Sulfotelmatobacter sp.]HWI57123.1 hypothetical protein [Bacillota bacterium]
MSHTTQDETRYLDAVRLLRSQENHRYFTGSGWTENPSLAQPFADDAEAIRACVSNDLHYVELVLRDPRNQTELFSTPMR